MGKSKDDFIVDATALGIELKGDETVPALKKLIADKEAENGDEGDGGESKDDILNEGTDSDDTDDDLDPDPVPTTKAKTRKGPEQPVFNVNGDIVRTYSAEKHGKKFKELAEEFAKKNSHKEYSLKK